MSIILRIILIIGSIASFYLCFKKMRQSKLKITNGIIWMLGSIILILMSLFSNVVEWISEKGNDIKQELIDYMLPLIQGEVQLEYENGLPSYLPVTHLKPGYFD